MILHLFKFAIFQPMLYPPPPSTNSWWMALMTFRSSSSSRDANDAAQSHPNLSALLHASFRPFKVSPQVLHRACKILPQSTCCLSTVLLNVGFSFSLETCWILKILASSTLTKSWMLIFKTFIISWNWQL